MGNNIVQQKDINWSKRILGKDALTQIKTNTIRELFKPKTTLDKNPLKEWKSNISSLIILYHSKFTDKWVNDVWSK